jgi:molybdenum cofactor biosynthesis enzyme MoaA
MKKLRIPSNQMRLILNYECNAKCSYCWKECQKDFSNSVKDLNLWKSFLNQLFQTIEKTEKIGLTGGEPLLFPNLPEICKICSHHTDKLQMVTNGSLPKIVSQVCPYLNEVHFSIDTLDKNKYKKIKGLSLETVLQSVFIAKTSKVNIKINTVVNDQLLSFSDLETFHGFCQENNLTLNLIKPFLQYSKLFQFFIDSYLSKGYRLATDEKRKFSLQSASDFIQITYCICDWVNLFSKHKSKDCLEKNSLFINYKFEAMPCLLKDNFLPLFDFKKETLLINNLKKAIETHSCLM